MAARITDILRRWASGLGQGRRTAAGQALPVAYAGGLCAQGLEMLAHDLVEHSLNGTPRFVARGRQGHARL